MKLSFTNALATKKKAIEPVLIKQEVKVQRKTRQFWNFTRGMVLLRSGKKNYLILLFTFATHALCELPCSSLCLTSQPVKCRHHHLWGREGGCVKRNYFFRCKLTPRFL